jgi:hypothetical protein
MLHSLLSPVLLNNRNSFFAVVGCTELPEASSTRLEPFVVVGFENSEFRTRQAQVSGPGGVLRWNQEFKLRVSPCFAFRFSPFFWALG